MTRPLAVPSTKSASFFQQRVQVLELSTVDSNQLDLKACLTQCGARCQFKYMLLYDTVSMILYGTVWYCMILYDSCMLYDLASTKLGKKFFLKHARHDFLIF